MADREKNPRYMGYHAEFGRSQSNGASISKELHSENRPSAHAFQSHSKSSKVIRFDQLPVTFY